MLSMMNKLCLSHFTRGSAVIDLSVFTLLLQSQRRWLALLGLLSALGLGLQPSAGRAQGLTGQEGDMVNRLHDAETNPKLAEQLYKTGKQVAAVCANCHGDSGNSVKPAIPNLAGQNPAYLLDQIHQFSTGKRRNEFMEGMMKVLKVDEKVGMVLFYSKQTVLGHKDEVNAALVPKGRDLYSKNCWRCHGEDGHGNAQFARIAGQQPSYLLANIKRYRQGFGERTNPLMAANTKLLSDADIDAVVAYIAGM